MTWTEAIEIDIADWLRIWRVAMRAERESVYTQFWAGRSAYMEGPAIEAYINSLRMVPDIERKVRRERKISDGNQRMAAMAEAETDKRMAMDANAGRYEAARAAREAAEQAVKDLSNGAA